MWLVPEKYDCLDLKPREKLLTNTFRRLYKDTNDMALLLKVRPVYSETVDFCLIHKKMGVIFIISLTPNIDKIDPFLDVYTRQLLGDLKNKIINKLLRHKQLQVRVGDKIVPKIPISFLCFFPELDREEVFKRPLSVDNRCFLDANCFFRDDIRAIKANKEYILERAKKVSLLLNPEWEEFDSDTFNATIHEICPEITIPRFGKDIEIRTLSTHVPAMPGLELQAGDQTIRTIVLDNDQINIVNNIKPGHNLILACAGSGKSVLLVAKAMKIASMFPEKKVLIICFNRNLRDFYRWRLEIAGLANRNIECHTIYSLCRQLMINAGLYNRIEADLNQKDYDAVFEKTLKAYEEQKISEKYYAVFIDEVQIFKKEWYKFCISLLEDPKNYFLTICGDKSQTINRNIKNGEAPWQSQEEHLPKYTGRTIRIEKNYRNCQEINEFINHFVTVAKRRMQEFGFDIEKDTDMFLRGNSVRKGNLPQVVVTSRKREASEVIRIISSLHDIYDVPYDEILVLFPYRGFKTLNNYSIHSDLQILLDRKNIKYSNLIQADDDTVTSYIDRKGVSLSTIESSLGLDFDAVIVCGLLSMGFYYKTKLRTEISTEEQKEDFIKNIVSLYTAFSRARNHLHIVLTELSKESIYSEIILRAESILKLRVKSETYDYESIQFRQR